MKGKLLIFIGGSDERRWLFGRASLGTSGWHGQLSSLKDAKPSDRVLIYIPQQRRSALIAKAEVLAEAKTTSRRARSVQ